MIAQAVVLAVLAAGTSVPVFAVQAAAAQPPHVSQVASVPVQRVAGHKVALRDDTRVAVTKAAAVTWPAATTATAALNGPAAPTDAPSTAAGRVRAGKLPVWVTPVAAAGRSGAKAAAKGAAPTPTATPGKVAVRMLDHATALKSGVNGLLFTAAATAGGGEAGIAVDYAAFKGAYGGDWSDRLRLVRLPACALTTPTVAACQRQTPLASTNDPVSAQVSTQVTLAAAPAATGTAARSAAVAGSAAAPMVIALTSSPTGGVGDFSATPLTPSGSWTAGGSSGDFTYSYPVTMPPAAGGLVPSVALSYDSQSVDGRLASTQNQASWVGDGWDYQPGSITRSYLACSDDPTQTAPAVDDECWDGQILHVAFGSTSGDIVADASTLTGWRMSNDDGEKVELLTDGNNGTYDGDYWKITTTDGTQYFFGLNRLPGWTTGKATTNSAWTVPVYGAHKGDPCYNATFASASCSQAWQWNLDYVVDPRGNAMAYYYDTETNYYGADNKTTGVPYVRAGNLDHIDYGFTSGNAYSASAPQRVQFTVGDRCVAATCDPIAGHTADWPDVPYDLNCDSGASCSNHTPSFWTTKRLASIATEIYQSGAYHAVDSYALTQTMPSPGDGTAKTLWLSQLVHTGSDGTTGTPAVTFAGAPMANRYNIGDGYPDLVRYRLTGITTETGDQIAVTYSDSSCTPGVAQSANTSRCFPVYWGPPGQATPILDWFNKYLVTSVTDNDSTGGSAALVTSYVYQGNPGWHYDDNEVVKPKNRTWGQWRGYPRVETLTGSAADGQTRTDTLYFQGMDGDTLPAGGSRTAGVTLDSHVTVPGAATVVTDSDQLAGRTRESITYNGATGSAVAATVDDYWISAATATRTRSGLPALTATMVRPSATSTTTAITSGAATTWRSTRLDQGYDPATGLLEYSDDHGDIAVPAQEKCTSVTYAPANTTTNLSGLVAESETDQGPCATGNKATTDGLGYPTAVSRPDGVISDTRTFYDTAPTSWPPTVPALPQTPPTRGEPTLLEKAKGYAGGAFSYQITNATSYDGYGRANVSWDALGNKTTSTFTTVAGLTTKLVVTNPKQQTTTTTISPDRGLTTASVDANGAETDTTYDALGRTTAVWLPGRSKATQSASVTSSYNVSASAPSTVTTKALTDGSGGIYTSNVQLFDALLRPRQTQTPTPAGGRLLTDTLYNSRGQAYKVNSAYWDGTGTPGTTLYSATDNLVPDQDLITFDAQGRAVLDTPKQLNVPVPGEQTRTVYGGDRTTTIPPTGGTTVTTVTDARGRTVETDDYLTAPTVNGDQVTGGTSASTRYTYDAAAGRGQLTKIVDPTGNVRTSSYNLLGEQTAQSDPDTGQTQLSYDAGGHLTQTVNADGKALTYAYDVLGRKTAEYDGTTTAAPELASWTYDDPAVADSIGRQTAATRYVTAGNATATAPAGAYTQAVTGFTVTGQPTGTKVTLPAALTAFGASTFTYTDTYTATTGLPLATTMPSAGTLPAETITTGYNALDMPNSIGGLATYASGTTYDAYSRVSKESLGLRLNSASLNYSYDQHTGRLTDVNTQRATAPATVDDTAYTYDPAGNITRTSDAQNNGTSTDTQCYTYDGLDRLTAAWTTADPCPSSPVSGPPSTPDVTGPNPYWTSWTFDGNGNRLTQDQHATGTQTGDTTTSYVYGKPGAPTQQPDTLSSSTTTLPDGTLTGATYGYDADGNNISATATPGTDSLTWNSENQLSSLSSTGQDNPTTYLYDADGNQLLRTDPDGSETLFLPGQELTYNPNTATLGGTRYITLPDGTTVSRYAAGTGYTFTAANDQGTGVLSLNSTAQTPTFRAFDPYGNPRGAAPTEATWHSDKGFVGGTQDTTTGLTNLGAREYDPALGRFISPDPVLEAADPNQIGGYAYAGDNPVTKTDPNGLRSECGQNGDTACDPNAGAAEGGQGTSGCADTDSCTALTQCDRTCQDMSKPDPTTTTGTTEIYPNVFVPNNLPNFSQFRQAFYQIVKQNCAQNGGGYDCDDPSAYDTPVSGARFSEMETDLQRDFLPACSDAHDCNVGMAVASIVAGKAMELSLGKGFTNSELADAVGTLCNANSFPGAALVLLADGKAVEIREVKVGDTVLAKDPVTGTVEAEPVTAVIKTLTDTKFTDLTVHTAAGDRFITSTQHHPYWDATTKHWTNAADLAVGDKLSVAGDTSATVTRVRDYTSHIVTYNLTVAELHTYYVLAGTTPILVHNATACPLSEAALKPGEGDTAARLMADPSYSGGQLRGFVENNAPEDFIDTNGKTYDAIGTTSAYERWNARQFLSSLQKHLYQKSADYTVLDLTGASSSQIDTIFSAMDSWAATRGPANSPAIILGDGY
ncbi:RHS repeat-associated core domain-containing protein [Streptacidiphilus sp. N8-3]|uniref:RHS repeat-associated core domain-containing protein n=1 Tax=Streptacidiphilus cavernicola TaxID=3342716 RepID=A0ABV6VS62_9ACTN